MRSKIILFSALFFAFILISNMYLTWKYNPFRPATNSEIYNFKYNNDFHHGIFDKITEKVYHLFYSSSMNHEISKKEIINKISIENQINCLKCYKKFNQEEGWSYDIGGIPTQNVKNKEKYFCSYNCARQRGKENTPKSWKRQFN